MGPAGIGASEAKVIPAGNPLGSFLQKTMGPAGIEPATVGLEPTILPLDYGPNNNP